MVLKLRNAQPSESAISTDLDAADNDADIRVEAEGAAITAATDDFDSDLLKMRIARVSATLAPSTEPEHWVQLYGLLKEQVYEAGYDQLLRRVDATNLPEIWALERTGFELMDIGVTFVRRFDSQLPETNEDDFIVRPATDADMAEFATEMVREPWGSRYEADPSYDPQDVRQLRLTWLQNSFETRAALFLVGELVSQVAGYVTCLFDESTGHGEVELIGTLPQFRGRRVASRILAHAVAWFSKRASLATVRTQATNIAAASLYEKAGFTLHCSDLSYRLSLNK